MGNDGIQARFHLAHGDFALDVELDLPGRGVSALFGASGSGKTSLLRCIAGLERVPGGYLRFRGEVWQDSRTWLPPHKRPLGYVFQEASLFPHLSVLGNLRYGLKRAGGDQAALQQAIELLGIGHLLQRRPDGLSGGERQRVAIARALAAAPRLLLMDEPLAALDLARKREILPYLERLHDELDIPVLYVSHAPDEVARLADHLVLLEGGRVLASGPVSETLARLDLPSALGDDAGVVIEGRVGAYDSTYQLLRLDLPGSAGLSLRVPHTALPIGQALRCRIHARDISLTLERQADTSILNLLPVRVVAEAPAEHPAHLLLRLEADGNPLLARITRYSRDRLGVRPNQQLWAQIKAVALLA
jgi:molybdate transport system ATP-binding protein